MGYDIKIGKVQLDTTEIIKDINRDYSGNCINYELEIIPCEFKKEGSEPFRAPSYTSWHWFMESCESTKEFSSMVNVNSSDGLCFILNTDEIKSIISRIELDKKNIDEFHHERLDWLCFWVKKAIEMYGDDAAIGFW